MAKMKKKKIFFNSINKLYKSEWWVKIEIALTKHFWDKSRGRS